MSGDEAFVTIVSTILAVGTWISITARIFRFNRYGLPAVAAKGLIFALPVCLTIVFAILRTMASHDVREDGRYIAMYGLMGAAWAGLAPVFFLPGISVRDDFLERRNASAGYAVLGFMLGSTLCFSGGNIGDGPGWWVVLFSALLANGTLTILWLISNGFTRIADRIVLDRDPAIGLRVAGFFIGAGLILGRAVAGDWHSAAGTVADFARMGWPVLILAGVHLAAERMARPRFHKDEQAVVTRGLFPALFYIAAGLAAALAQGEIE